MTDELLEQRLQDYLDDRLSVEDRKRFEERIRSDPELAEQVADHLELRAALSDRPAEQLPEGFIERARARFEAAHRPRSRWSRLVSWEAAGLAAAALLLVAILLPDHLDQRREWDTADTIEKLAAHAQPEPEALPGGVESKELAQQEPVSGPYAPVPQDEHRQTAEPRRAVSRADADAPADDAPALGESRYEVDEVEQVAVAKKAATRPAEQPSVAELAPGATDSSTPWTARVIDDEQEWTELVDSSAASTEGYAMQRARVKQPPTVDFATQRVVLVETRSGFASCSAISWHLEGDNVVIELPVPDASRPQPVRCEIVVPAGDGSVELRGLKENDGR